jgi:hypothetical protein
MMTFLPAALRGVLDPCAKAYIPWNHYFCYSTTMESNLYLFLYLGHKNLKTVIGDSGFHNYHLESIINVIERLKSKIQTLKVM